MTRIAAQKRIKEPGMKKMPPVRAQLAYERLVAAIQSGQLTSGSRVREADVAEWLQISRTPVREAMRRLEAEGMLSHMPHVGVIVTELDAEMVTELYAMREVLEGSAAGLAAQHASEAEIHMLQQIVKGEKALLHDPDSLMRHNREFHDIIYRSAHNRYLLKSLNALHDALVLLGKTTLSSKARADTSHAEQLAIVKAIIARDQPLAEKLMRAHIRGAYHERLNMLFIK
ncbi:MAG: GntR family transcriptional regulator [Proteobacteria bacterium]|nr:GntR family transcriptional regulator [Pseudomonadota bacterium]